MDKHSYNKRKSEFVTRYELCKTYHDFRDLNTQVSDRTEKGDYFEIFSEAYFKSCHPASNNIKNYWPRHTIPSEVVELLRLSKEDKGTDFVIEHNDGSFSLGQCKFVWDEDRTLAKKYLDSFIAETALVSPKVKIKNKHILTTASDVHDYIKQLQGLDVINNSNLNDTAEMENIVRYLRSEKPVYTYKDRHPLTKRVIKKAKNHFKKNDKGRLVIFCGGRKTLTSEDIALEVLLNISGVLKKKLNKTVKVCFAAPSIALLTQTLNEWSKDLKARNIPYDFRVVCSDATAQNTESDDRSYGAFNLDEVKEWYDNKNKELKIVFTTFDSAENASQIGKFDFTIIDEAHQTVTRFDSNKSFIVSDRFRSKKKMFQTATEKTINTDSDEFFSMDNEDQYGKLIANVTYSMLVKAEMIVPLELVLLSSDHWSQLPIEERMEVEDNVYYRDGIKKNVPAKDLRSAYLLKKFMDNHEDETHYIYGCNSNSKARDIADYLKHIMPSDVGVFNVDGEMTISKRQDIMGKFERSNRAIVTNCRCLGVGISINKVSGTIMGDPMQTKVGIVQFAGRATRRNGNKSVGRVIIPVQSEQYLNGELENDEAYKSALCLLTTLIANDPNLMTIARARLGKGKSSPKIAKQKLDKKDEEIYDKLVNKIIKDKVFFEKITKQVVRNLNQIGMWVDITKEEFEYYKNKKYNRKEIAQEKGFCNPKSVDDRCTKLFGITYSEFTGNSLPRRNIDINHFLYCYENKLSAQEASKFFGEISNKNVSLVDLKKISYTVIGMTYNQFMGIVTKNKITKDALLECKNKKLSLEETKKYFGGVDKATLNSAVFREFNVDTYVKWAKVSKRDKFNMENIKNEILKYKKMNMGAGTAARELKMGNMTLWKWCNKLFQTSYGKIKL